MTNMTNNFRSIKKTIAIYGRNLSIVKYGRNQLIAIALSNRKNTA